MSRKIELSEQELSDLATVLNFGLTDIANLRESTAWEDHYTEQERERIARSDALVRAFIRDQEIEPSLAP